MPSGFLPQRHAEVLENFGEVSGGVHDLQPVLREMREARREYVAAGEADYESTISAPQPPAVVWQYMVDPVQRLRWACVMFNRDPDEFSPNPRGRAGVGAKIHCNHGPAEAYREIIDWRPYRYFTTRGMTRFRGGLIPARRIVETFEFVPREDNETLLTWRLRFVDRDRLAMLTLRGIRLFLWGGIRHGAARLQAAIEEDLGANAAAELDILPRQA